MKKLLFSFFAIFPMVVNAESIAFDLKCDREKYNLDDLLSQLREKGYKSIEEIEYAILESNGTLSVFPYEKQENYLPLPLILDSKIQEETLRHLHKDSKWALNLLERKNININDVFYAFYKDKNIFIIKNSDLI